MTEQQLLEIAINTSIEAGFKIMEIYTSNDFDIQLKSDDSPLTKADLLANELICKALQKTNIPILSEEGKHEAYERRKNWTSLWIVDPIDGTKEFIKKNGEFTVNIALVENQIPNIGVIYVPVTKEIYFSSKEIGTYKSVVSTSNLTLEELIKSAEKLPTTQSKNEYIIAASRSHLSKATEDFIAELSQKHESIKLVSKGSSLKLCMVAEGSVDCYPRFAPTMEWDTAAGHAICLNAGKDVFDYKTNKSMLYNREILTNNWFIVK